LIGLPGVLVGVVGWGEVSEVVEGVEDCDLNTVLEVGLLIGLGVGDLEANADFDCAGLEGSKTE
jgi:hypothetical protein